MSYNDLYFNFTPPRDNTSPNLYVKETVATLVEYAKDKGPGVYSLEIERYPHIHMNVKMREDYSFDMEMVNGNVHPDYLSINVDPFRPAFSKWYEEDTISENKIYSRNGHEILYNITIEQKIWPYAITMELFALKISV